MTDTPLLTTRFDKALVFAHELHRFQYRKANRIPYISHLLSVAALVIEDDGDEDQAIAALLHDAVEDQGGLPTLERIRAEFGERVAEIVAACTDTHEDPKPDWRPRKEAYLASLPGKPAYILKVVCADKLHNARSILTDLPLEGPALWEKFTGEKSGTLWYYRALHTALLAATGGGRLVDELGQVVSEIEALAASQA